MDSDPLWVNAGKNGTVGTATIEADDELFTLTAHGLAPGDSITVDTLTGGAVGVLIADAVYFVVSVPTADTFSLSRTPGGVGSEPVTFAADGGAAVYRWAPQYTAQEQRRALGGLLFGGVAGRFGARSGVFPNTAADDYVTLADPTWTVQHMQGGVDPALTTLSGPYLVQIPEESGALDPRHATLARVDAIDIQVQDDDEDSEGFRRVHPVYVAGSPGGGAPLLTDHSFRAAIFNVPAQGGGAATVTVVAPMIVARGGILPVRDATELPTAGTYDGMVAWQQNIEALVVDDGTAAWDRTIGTTVPTMQVFNSSGTWNKPLGLKAVRVRAKAPAGAGGGAGATGGTGVSAGAGGGEGGYAESIIPASLLGSSETVTVGAGGTGVTGTSGNPGSGPTSFGTHVVAAPGDGGLVQTTTIGRLEQSFTASGGTGTTGQILVTGAPGQQAIIWGSATNPNSHSGSGGGNGLGKGQPANANGINAGANSGAGGGGAANSLNQSARPGGNGGSGRVVVEHIF